MTAFCEVFSWCLIISDLAVFKPYWEPHSPRLVRSYDTPRRQLDACSQLHTTCNGGPAHGACHSVGQEGLSTAAASAQVAAGLEEHLCPSSPAHHTLHIKLCSSPLSCDGLCSAVAAAATIIWACMSWATKTDTAGLRLTERFHCLCMTVRSLLVFGRRSVRCRLADDM